MLKPLFRKCTTRRGFHRNVGDHGGDQVLDGVFVSHGTAGSRISAHILPAAVRHRNRFFAIKLAAKITDCLALGIRVAMSRQMSLGRILASSGHLDITPEIACAVGGGMVGCSNRRGRRFSSMRSRGVVGTCMALGFFEAGCTTIAEREHKYGAPSNYRQLIARELMKEASPYSRATISQPAEVFAGAINGGTRPVICATTFNEGGLLPTATRWIFLFEDGRISAKEANPGAIYCAGVPESPFPEALKQNG